MAKAWKLTHTKQDITTASGKKYTTLLKFVLTLPVDHKTNISYNLTIDLDAPPIIYVQMQQWFLELFQKLWWTEPDSRNFLFYNQVIDDFIKVIVSYRNHPDAKYPFE